jgi:hypothetical protein
MCVKSVENVFLADHDHEYMVPDMVPASGFNGPNSRTNFPENR